MQGAIEAINKLQEIYANVKLPTDINLPMIAVVGAQSTGKSSVLETIVGRDFLPRGSGIVTRRPLILHLTHTYDKKEYGIFNHRPGEIFEDFDKIRQEIIDETDRICGKDKAVSEKPIILKIYSKDVVDLSLIDLPGLTKVPVNGQPNNIEQILRQMVLNFISLPSCLVLAVTAGNTDLANSDALRIAREVDPKGDRTIGVITKLDLMDEGTNALEVLEGRLYPLKLGYIGVVCRSQKDILDGKSMKNSLKSEEEFFENNIAYRSIKNRCGIKYLSHTLNKLLMRHIVATIPSLKANITALLGARMNEIKTYGLDLVGANNGNLNALLLYMISKFVEYYNSNIEGNLVKDITKELHGGARIDYVFHSVYTKAIKSVKSTAGITETEIRTAIKNAKGMHATISTPPAAIEFLVSKYVEKLLQPSIQCIDLVHKELKRIINTIDDPELLRFKKLMTKISEIMNEVLTKCLPETEQVIRSLIEAEKSRINEKHPDMIQREAILHGLTPAEQANQLAELEKTKKERIKREEEEKKREEAKKKEGKGLFKKLFGWGAEREDKKSGASPANNNNNLNAEINIYQNVLPENMRATGPPSEEELAEMNYIKRILKAYLKIVKKNVADLVPKTIMHFLVNRSKAIAQNELISKLYVEGSIEEIMAENPEILEKRKECTEMITALQKSLKVLQEVEYSDKKYE